MSPSEILLAPELTAYAAAVVFIVADTVGGWKSSKGGK